MKIIAVEISDIKEERIDKLSSLIDPKKRYIIGRFINKKDKIRALIGEILIRTIIVEKLRIRNEYITFEKNQHGKPYLREYSNFHFNISHSGDFVVCAVDDKPIGIDIEEEKHIEYKEIAKNYFTVNEFDYINKQDLEIQLSKFYEVWTLKESFIKCCGQGLTIPLNSFYIHIDEIENIKVITNDECKEHIFKQFNIEQGYKMAVCSLNKKISNNVILIDQNRLINNCLRLSLGHKELY